MSTVAFLNKMETRRSFCEPSPWNTFTHQMSKISNCVSGWFSSEDPITRSSDFSALGLTTESTSTFNMLGLNFGYGNVSISTSKPMMSSCSEPFYTYNPYDNPNGHYTYKPSVSPTEILNKDIMNCATDMVMNHLYPLMDVQSATLMNGKKMAVEESKLNPEAAPWWPPYMDVLDAISNCDKTSELRDENLHCDNVAVPTESPSSSFKYRSDCKPKSDSVDSINSSLDSECPSVDTGKSYAAALKSSVTSSRETSPSKHNVDYTASPTTLKKPTYEVHPKFYEKQENRTKSEKKNSGISKIRKLLEDSDSSSSPVDCPKRKDSISESTASCDSFIVFSEIEYSIGAEGSEVRSASPDEFCVVFSGEVFSFEDCGDANAPLFYQGFGGSWDDVTSDADDSDSDCDDSIDEVDAARDDAMDAVNKLWQIQTADVPTDKPEHSGKQVTFCADDIVYDIPKPCECREKYWELKALDRQRFARRVEGLEDALNEVLLPSVHREKMRAYISSQGAAS